MIQIFLIAASIEANNLFGSPVISLILLVFSCGGIRVIDRNYISYFSY